MYRQLALAGLISVSIQSPVIQRDNPSSFKDIPVTKDLSWTPCYGNYTCINLEVPLDYEDLAAGTTNIAFVKWSATKQPALGDIIFNPGGPGGSAVDFVSRASGVRTITSRLGESYNIIGMDPRGVGSSGPLLDCFDGNHALRDYFFNQQFMARFDYNSAVDMKYTFEESGAFGEWCTKKLPQSAKYANTPATAQDMLHYFEKAAEKDGKSAEEAKVNYYGVSYGSTLGMTFAQIYPERVGNFIIDGVMDFDDYYSGRYMHSMDQGDEAAEAFNTFCFEAGSKCAFFRDDASADAIKKRVDAILADVEETPIPVSDPHWVQFPTVVSHIDVREYILGRVYSPMGTFPGLAVALSDLERRNGSRVASGKAVMPKAVCDNASPEYNDRTALITISCVDTNGGFNFSSTADWEQYIEDIQEIGHYFGPNWGKVIGPNCRKLDIFPPQSQVWNGYKETETSNPILFVTNVIDPVTPSHEKMSALFPGSVVLKQDAVGHSVTSAVSECTSTYMTKYMETGDLPPADTLCEPKVKNPFLQ